MRKNKTSLGISKLISEENCLDEQIKASEGASRAVEDSIAGRRDQLLRKQLQQVKDSKMELVKEIQAYRKVVFKQGDIHEILEMQHQKIFQLTTSLEVLQNKYDKLLATSGSSQQTYYAVKCKELEKQLMEREVEHQKEISGLKSRLMKNNAHELYQQMPRSGALSANIISPLRANKKFV